MDRLLFLACLVGTSIIAGSASEAAPECPAGSESSCGVTEQEETDAEALIQAKVSVWDGNDAAQESIPALVEEEDAGHEVRLLSQRKQNEEGEWGTSRSRIGVKKFSWSAAKTSYQAPSPSTYSYESIYYCPHRSSIHAGIPGMSLAEKEKFAPSPWSPSGTYSPTVGSGSTCIDPLSTDNYGWCSGCEEAHGPPCDTAVSNGDFASRDECFRELMCNAAASSQIAASWKASHCPPQYPNYVAGCTPSLLEQNESQVKMDEKPAEEAAPEAVSLDETVSGKRCA